MQLVLFSACETNSDLANMGQSEWLLIRPFLISIIIYILTINRAYCYELFQLSGMAVLNQKAHLVSR